MNDSSPRQPNSRMLSDKQMDALLSGFFRLETPTELDQPFRPAASPASSLSLRTELAAPENAIVHRSQKLIVVSALAALVLTLLVMFVNRDESGADRSAAARKGTEQTEPMAPDENLMLVSPNAGLRPAAVGADGVTLEETDTIELKAPPQKP